MRFPFTIVAVLILASAALAARAADEVTIYRCTDAAGHLTLRDTPCGKGQKQQTRTMLRPKDAPTAPRVAPALSRTRGDADDGVAAPRTVYLAPPHPMYECTTPDGDRYTSDTDDGRPRWVPLWTLGYPIALPRHQVMDRAGLSITSGRVHIDGQRTILQPPMFYGAAAYGAGTWIRDDCQGLPPDEVCARLVDRRDAIRTRFFNAMPSERDQLRIEERGITARLGNDCGGG